MFLAGWSVRIQASTQTVEAACPACGTVSRRIHSRYERRLCDTAVAGQETMLHLRVRRFFCVNDECTKKTFAEQVLQGRNATADRARLAQLFGEAPIPLRSAGRRLTPPDLPRATDGSPAADFVVRTNLLIPVDAATWRPLSERGVGQLADNLNSSPLQPMLAHWCTGLGIGGFTPFRRSGFNRARHVRLAWRGAVQTEPPSSC